MLHGDYVKRKRDGTLVLEGAYVDGRRHGRWIVGSGSGAVGEGSYVDGKRHGRWVIRYTDGYVSRGEYKTGDKDGREACYDI